MLCTEKAALARDLTPQTIVVAVFDKPPLQALRRDARDGLVVAASPGDCYGIVINVGAKDLDVAERVLAVGHALMQKDSNGIDFLRRSSTRAPKCGSARRCLGETNAASAVLFESLKCIGISEELGDANEQFMEQGLELATIRLEALDVAGDIVNMQHLHAALDAPDRVFPCIH